MHQAGQESWTNPKFRFHRQTLSKSSKPCELLNESELTKDEITSNYDFDPRQTNYYTDAGRYLD